MPHRAEHPAYRWYVLAVMTVIYAMNYVDRQIVTILAPYLKADLAITDAQLGLLYGTAFALFYGLFGIPLAKLADGWSRVRTLALGLSFWSLMTTLSGLSSNFGQLGAARIGVGVGEASSTPAAVSLLGDYFDRARRGTFLALYSVGVYLGAGASLMIGGSVVSAWTGHFGTADHAPFGLAGWQAAFIAVGLPGLVLAALVMLTIREPVRGRLEAMPAPRDPHPFTSALRELGAMIPPWSILRLVRTGASRSEIRRNILLLAGMIVMIGVITVATDSILSPARRAPLGHVLGIELNANLIQWIAIGFAAYACASWFRSIRRADPEAHRHITGSTTFRLMILAGACLAFAMNAVNGFVFVYATRYLHFLPAAGLNLGAIAAICGGLGITLSGIVCDRLRLRFRSGRIYFVCGTASLFTLASAIQYTTGSVGVFYVAYAVANFFVPMWFGPMQATTQDLVVPRLRGIAFAAYSLGPNIIGLGLGPYCVGLLSDATGDLRLAILAALAILPVALALLLIGARTLPRDEALVPSHA